MTTIDFITELFCQVDDNVDEDKHPQSNLYPSEIVTLSPEDQKERKRHTPTFLSIP